MVGTIAGLYKNASFSFAESLDVGAVNTQRKPHKICQVVTRVSMCFTSCGVKLDPGVRFPHYDLFCFSPWTANTAIECCFYTPGPFYFYFFTFLPIYFSNLLMHPICTPGVFEDQRGWTALFIWIIITFPFACLGCICVKNARTLHLFPLSDFPAKWKTMSCGKLPTGRTCEAV